MEEIEAGEYIRTKEGLIEKIKEFIPHYTKGKRVGQGKEEWGAEKGKDYYVLEILEIVGGEDE